MLSRLQISNYALIDNVDLTFNKGFTTITGETGAGKSILLKALNLLLGDRVDTSVLKQSENKCFLEAEFDISGLNLKDLFTELDFDYEEKTIIRREFTAEGKSRSFVNDSPVQLTSLKKLGEHLISIHSQHESIHLLDANYQLDVLDHVAGIAEEVKAYRKKYRELQRKIHQLAELKVEDIEARKEKDYLEFLLTELESAELSKLDLAELEANSAKIENAEKINEGIAFALSIFENDTIGPLNGIRNLIETFQDLSKYDPKYADILSRLLSVKIEMDDMENEISGLSSDIDFSEEDAQLIQEKMELINNLLFKHHLTEVNDLIQLEKELSEKLKTITGREDEIVALEKDLSQLKNIVQVEAEAISKSRKKAIPEFEKKIKSLLGELAMPDAELKVELISNEQPDNNGLERIDFLFKTNMGGGFLKIKKIASGGELARLMMSILSTLSNHKNLPTLIFDEIDTGVSGEVAAKIARQFELMGQQIQLIAITHLAQVAARGKQHLHVAKEIVKGKTVSTVRSLDNQEERIIELAKIISGEDVNDAAKENALHLLNNT